MGYTYREQFDAAMKCQTEEDAAYFLNRDVDYTYVKGNYKTRTEALNVVKVNLGYMAGYYDQSVQDRVLALFGAVHPVFGTRHPEPQEAFAAGVLKALGVDVTEGKRKR